MKKFITLITYILLIITTFIIPINSSIFTLNMSNIVETDQADEPFIVQPNTIVLTKLDNPDDLFTFAIDSSKKLTDRERAQLTFTGTLTDYLKNAHSLTLEDFNYEIEDSAQRVIYHIKSLKKQRAFTSEDLSISVALMDETLQLDTYLFTAADALKPNGMTDQSVTAALVPIYYNSDRDVQYPVYTKLKAGKNSFRRIINALANTPNYPGIVERTQFPYISYVWYSAGTLELKMLSSELTEFSDPTVAENTLKCLLNTVKDFSGDLVVNKVSLIIDETKSSLAFGNIAIDEPFTVDRNPQVYLPLLQNGQLTWLPKDITSRETADETIKQIIIAYQHPYGVCKCSEISPLLAKTVELEQANVVGNTLRLSFNNALAEYCKDHTDYPATLIEGLALSATTLPDIDSIELYIGETKLNKLGNYAFDNPILRPLYFNVDLNYIK